MRIIKSSGKKAEHVEQITFMKWLKLQHPLLEKSTFHIPNERKCTPSFGAWLKKLGVKPGVPDLFIAKPFRGFHGLFIEMKAEDGITKPSQKEFIERLNNDGYFACVCHGFDAARHIINWYLGLIEK